MDLAEDRAERHIPMTMEDWAKRLDLFLMADDREVLQDAGKITAEIAKWDGTMIASFRFTLFFAISTRVDIHR